jgi:hypothetical protein
MLKMLAVATMLALATSPVQAQTSPPDTLLNKLVGRWVLRGTIARQQTVHDVTFRWVLDSEYIEMHEVSRERKANGTPEYEAIVYLGRDPRTGEYAVQWMDNTAYGAFDPAGVGKAVAAGDSIPFLFNYSPETRFHTTFVYHRTTDTWEWHMDNDAKGVRSPFARVTLTRQ